MTAKEILKDAEENFETARKIRRKLHKNPEIEFDLNETIKTVQSELSRLKIDSKKCGRAGVCAHIGNPNANCILLRADMDALKIKEETELEFKSQNEFMHACGHDMHTAMLLSAAAILKKHEHSLSGCVKLMFQGAEETLSGAEDMIKAGILENPKPSAAMMLHVTIATPFNTGNIIVSDEKISAPSADYFEITVEGSGAHGAMPNLSIDPITISARIITALEHIHSRELSIYDKAVLTIGKLQAGNALNVIPEKAILGGTVRCFDTELRQKLKNRIKEISEGMAKTFGAKAEIKFLSGCPSLVNDQKLAADILKYQKELLGNAAYSQKQINEKNSGMFRSLGSEDFSYISHEIPSVMLAISAGGEKEGYKFPLHHPKMVLNEETLIHGAAAYAYSAIRWLEDNK